MNAEAYNAIRARWERERSAAQAKADRLAEQIKDLDKTWRQLSESAENAEEIGPFQKNGTLASRVVDAIATLPDTFDSSDVWGAIHTAYPGVYVDDSNFRASVSNVLKRLVPGTLLLDEQGAGRRPSRYRRASAAPASGAEEGEALGA